MWLVTYCGRKHEQFVPNLMYLFSVLVIFTCIYFLTYFIYFDIINMTSGMLLICFVSLLKSEVSLNLVYRFSLFIIFSNAVKLLLQQRKVAIDLLKKT